MPKAAAMTLESATSDQRLAVAMGDITSRAMMELHSHTAIRKRCRCHVRTGALRSGSRTSWLGSACDGLSCSSVEDEVGVEQAHRGYGWKVRGCTRRKVLLWVLLLPPTGAPLIGAAVTAAAGACIFSMQSIILLCTCQAQACCSALSLLAVSLQLLYWQHNLSVSASNMRPETLQAHSWINFVMVTASPPSRGSKWPQQATSTTFVDVDGFMVCVGARVGRSAREAGGNGENAGRCRRELVVWLVVCWELIRSTCPRAV